MLHSNVRPSHGSGPATWPEDRKSTRLNSSHRCTSYAVFCLKKKMFRRLRARGVRGDVALGHCMRQLLPLVFAVRQTGQPFVRDHYPWEPSVPSQAIETAAEP